VNHFSQEPDPNKDPASRAKLWEHHAKLLLSIQKTRGFILIIVFEQRHIRLNLCLEAFKALQEVANTFEREGARMLAIFRYDNPCLHPPIVYNVLHALRDPDSNWRQEAEAFLDSVCGIYHFHILRTLFRDMDVHC
jgi:FAD/FMN-containing dehydrogenase